MLFVGSVKSAGPPRFWRRRRCPRGAYALRGQRRGYHASAMTGQTRSADASFEVVVADVHAEATTEQRAYTGRIPVHQRWRITATASGFAIDCGTKTARTSAY